MNLSQDICSSTASIQYYQAVFGCNPLACCLRCSPAFLILHGCLGRDWMVCSSTALRLLLLLMAEESRSSSVQVQIQSKCVQLHTVFYMLSNLRSPWYQETAMVIPSKHSVRNLLQEEVISSTCGGFRTHFKINKSTNQIGSCLLFLRGKHITNIWNHQLIILVVTSGTMDQPATELHQRCWRSQQFKAIFTSHASAKDSHSRHIQS